jgi:hypothetical protein
MSYYRRFEIVADTMYKQRLIRGFCHLYDGQVRETIHMHTEIVCVRGARKHTWSRTETYILCLFFACFVFLFLPFSSCRRPS